MVTVRTYDAEKSKDLLDLFGNLEKNDLSQYHRKGILCRHFEILPLNEDEIRQVFDQIPPLKHIYNSVSPEFKQLLVYPFNLWLLEKILKNPQDVHALSQIHSEVQLLDLFWQRRNEDESDEPHRRFLLEQIVCEMIKERSLTVRQNDVYKDLDIDNPARLKAWNELLSDEILAKVPSNGQLITFSHDILFDYAISVLVIDEKPQQLEDFVREDPSRPLFLRPSFTYFFTRLWYNAPGSFWNIFWHIFPNSQSAHLRLARLIPTNVIANEARTIAQLTPLLDKLARGESIANDAIACLLQSLRALEIEIDELWSKLFDRVSAHLRRDFAWELATLTSEILDRAMNSENATIIDDCGRVGRRLLAWVWQESETSEDDRYNRIGSYWAVPLVAKTYGTNTEESQTLLEKVLALKREDHSSMDSLTRLAEDVDKIWVHDPEFVAQIYRTGITSTRRQDYSMCQYQLVEHFPNFLQAEPLTAARAAIQSLNVFIIDDRILRYRQDCTMREDLKETFEFHGKLACFVQDDSNAWDEREILAEPIKVADTLFEFIAELARLNDSLLDSLLGVFRDHVKVAFFWKRLLKTASQFPAVFAPRLFELCIAKPILMRDEVMYEIGLFLKTAAPEFTPDQLRQIEASILELPRDSEDNRKFYEHRRNQLLRQISPDLLRTNEGKKIREEMERDNADPENQPQVGFGSWSGHYSEEEQLQGQGVDTTAPENQELQRFFEPLKKFSSDWLNGEPTEEVSTLILPTLKEGYAAVKGHTEADKQVINRLWYKLADCTAILARAANDPGSHLFAFCRQMLLHAARHEQPEPNPELDAQFNSSIYSRLPRHGATEGLLRLTVHHSDAEILDAIESLASDPVPSVRMVTAMGLSMVYTKTPDRFWRIVEERATCEPNHVVREQICNTLDRVVRQVPEEEDRTIRVMDRMLKSIPAHAATLQRLDSYVDLLMWLAFSREKPWAIETIKRVFYKTPIHFGNSLQHTVFRVMRDYVVLKHLKTDEGRKTVQLTIAWLKRVVDVASETIEELCDTSNGARTAETEEKLNDIYKVIDQVIMRLYYASAFERAQSEEISNELRCCFYNQVKPVMEKIVALSQDNRESGVVFAKTAGYFIRTLTSFLSCKPKEVLHLAVGVAKSSKQSGYNFDSHAVKDVVKFVEIILADHRNEVRDGEGLKDLQNLLDIFIEAGWSDALRLVGRLDEIFR